MTDVYTTLSCIAMAIATTCYAIYLRSKRGAYAPRWTWLTVVVGVSIVLAVVGIRLLFLPLPALPPGYSADDLVRWAFQWALLQVIWHFVFGGAPIIIWQITQVSEQLEAALRRATKDRH
jgi:hypothetical protein